MSPDLTLLAMAARKKKEVYNPSILEYFKTSEPVAVETANV